MLFFGKNSPYTLAYILDTLSYNIASLPKKSALNQLSIAEKKVLEASTIIKLIDPEELEADENGFREDLDGTINTVADLISSVTSSLSSLYFNHSVMQLSFLATDKTLLMKYKLVHKTTYIYGDAIHYQCIVCLHPISSERQICEDFKLLMSLILKIYTLERLF
jgi:hypothetical protein